MQAPSIHASRKHEDYEYDDDGHITPPLRVSRIARRKTTTTTSVGTSCHTQISTQQHVHHTKEKDGGVSGGNVVSALLGAAAGAAVAYAVFNTFSDKKGVKNDEVTEASIRMYSRPPSANGGGRPVPERSCSLNVINEDRRPDIETFQPEVRLAIMPSRPQEENVWVRDKVSKVPRSVARESMDLETLVNKGESRSMNGGGDQDTSPHQATDGEVAALATSDGTKNSVARAESSTSRSRAPESYVTAGTRMSAQQKSSPGDKDDASASIPESGSESESGQDVKGSHAAGGSTGIPFLAEINDLRSQVDPILPKEDWASVLSRRSRRSHCHEDDRYVNRDHYSTASSGRKWRKSSSSGVGTDRKERGGSEVSHGSRSHRSHIGEDDEARNRSRRRMHRSSTRRDSHEDHLDPHQLLRETEHSTDAIIGANFAKKIAAIALGRRRKVPEESTVASSSNNRHHKSRHRRHRNLSPTEIPLPPGSRDARSCLSAAEIPLPESELGGTRVDEVLPEDSVSNVGGRRRR